MAARSRTACASRSMWLDAIRGASGPDFHRRPAAWCAMRIGRRGSRARRELRDRAAARGGRQGRFPQRHPRPYRQRRGALPRDPRHGRQLGPASRFRRRGAGGGRRAGLPRGAHQDVATARHAIAAGKLDMVGMTRAHIADPHIARKVGEGREHDIRPCVGASYCIDRIYDGGEALCIHNAATGREATMPHEVTRYWSRNPVRTGRVGRRRVMAGSGTILRRVLTDRPGGLLPGGDKKPSVAISGVFRLLADAVCMGCAPGEHVAWRIPRDRIEAAARGQVARQAQRRS